VFLSPPVYSQESMMRSEPAMGVLVEMFVSRWHAHWLLSGSFAAVLQIY
jgi:hypothetical protein